MVLVVVRARDHGGNSAPLATLKPLMKFGARPFVESITFWRKAMTIHSVIIITTAKYVHV
jgi:hypothetical protein